MIDVTRESDSQSIIRWQMSDSERAEYKVRQDSFDIPKRMPDCARVIMWCRCDRCGRRVTPDNSCGTQVCGKCISEIPKEIQVVAHDLGVCWLCGEDNELYKIDESTYKIRCSVCGTKPNEEESSSYHKWLYSL